MPKGPRLNNISKNFTTRDSLGVEGVATSIQAEICPIVNTVTPRAFYWPFMVWIYYDFYKYSGIQEYSVEAFDAYLKHQDYFFVLAVLLTKGSDQNYLVGKLQAQINIDENPEGPYLYDSRYFKTRYGGMQYYNAGCLSMYFITDEDLENNKQLSFPALRPEGVQMAKAFEAVIKDTAYYKFYRRNDEAVPRNVLEEYGKTINIGLTGFDECKSLLRHYMFEDDRAVQLIERSRLLTECANYLKLIVTEHNVKDLSLSAFRRLAYDRLLPSGKELEIPEACISVAHKWEIVVGRMYFTSGIEMIWKYMLEQLTEPLTLKDWIDRSFRLSDFSWDIHEPLSKVIPECFFDNQTRESMIDATARKNTSPYSIENGIKIVLSVYNRFQNRKDLEKEKVYLNYGANNQSISMNEMFDQVEAYKQESIQRFIVFVMQHWLIDQHYFTALDKMFQGRDGFYYECVDGKYVKRQDFSLAFQGIRLLQLAQVMEDLDML